MFVSYIPWHFCTQKEVKRGSPCMAKMMRIVPQLIMFEFFLAERDGKSDGGAAEAPHLHDVRRF
jgi:hypothetical protein